MTKSSRETKKKLKNLGLKRSRLLFFNPWYFVLIIILFAIIAGIVVDISNKKIDPANAVVAIVAIGAFILGLQQWRANQHEISLEKFYDRLDIANRRLDQWPAARKLVSHFWSEGESNDHYEKAMYVYVELDNLEYVIEKYLMGFMEPKDALRGVNTFKSRCKSKLFINLALKQVILGEYKPATVSIVQKICSQCLQELKDSKKAIN